MRLNVESSTIARFSRKLVISIEITLALFEDSGWYKVYYETANIFLWGKDVGCDFFLQKCLNFDSNHSVAI